MFDKDDGVEAFEQEIDLAEFCADELSRIFIHSISPAGFDNRRMTAGGAESICRVSQRPAL